MAFLAQPPMNSRWWSAAVFVGGAGGAGGAISWGLEVGGGRGAAGGGAGARHAAIAMAEHTTRTTTWARSSIPASSYRGRSEASSALRWYTGRGMPTANPRNELR